MLRGLLFVRDGYFTSNDVKQVFWSSHLFQSFDGRKIIDFLLNEHSFIVSCNFPDQAYRLFMIALLFAFMSFT